MFDFPQKYVIMMSIYLFYEVRHVEGQYIHKRRKRAQS